MGESLVGSGTMAHNCWFVGFGLLKVPSITYRWPLRHGGCFRDRLSHPEGDCAYQAWHAILLVRLLVALRHVLCQVERAVEPAEDQSESDQHGP